MAKALAAVVVLTLIVLVAASFLNPRGTPGNTVPAVPAGVNSVYTGSGTLPGHGTLSVPILPNATSISGLASAGSSSSARLSVTLSTYASGTLAYLAISIPNSVIHVVRVDDSTNLSWSLRTDSRGSSGDLETWYATSAKALDRDNVTVTLSGPTMAQAVALGFTGIKNLADPFVARSSNATGSGPDASVQVRASGPAIILGIVAAPGNVSVNASNGFSMDQERRSPTLALETVKNFRVCVQNCLPGRTSIVIPTVSAEATLTPASSWRILGDAIVSGLPTFGHPPRGSNQSAPLVATCADGIALVPATMTDSADAMWYQGVANASASGSVVLTGIGSGYVSYSAGGQKCAIAPVPTTTYNGSAFCVCDLIVIIYNNQSTPSSYTLHSYLTNQSALPKVVDSILGVPTPTSGGGVGSGGSGGGGGFGGPWTGIASLSMSYIEPGGTWDMDFTGVENFQVSPSGAITGYGSYAGFLTWTYSDSECMGQGTDPIDYTESLSGQVVANGTATVNAIVSGLSGGTASAETCVYVNAAGYTTTDSSVTPIPEQSIVYSTSEEVQFVNGYSTFFEMPAPYDGSFSYALLRG